MAAMTYHALIVVSTFVFLDWLGALKRQAGRYIRW
jgi:hypothetical protein